MDMPDPLKDFEPTKPYAPAWVEWPIEIAIHNPGWTACVIVVLVAAWALLA